MPFFSRYAIGNSFRQESIERDWRDKYFEYEKAGVREYWIIHRDTGRIEAYTLAKNGKYQKIVASDAKIHSMAIPGFYLRPKWLLGAKPPRLRDVLRELGVK